MTLDEAIKHCEEVAHEKRIESGECISVNDLENAEACYECGEDHKQLALWLTELKRRREADKQGLEINRWIPCSEKLPEIYEKVLTADRDGNVTENFRCNIKTGVLAWSKGFWITHWMPLPEPPKEADHD